MSCGKHTSSRVGDPFQGRCGPPALVVSQKGKSGVAADHPDTACGVGRIPVYPEPRGSIRGSSRLLAPVRCRGRALVAMVREQLDERGESSRQRARGRFRAFRRRAVLCRHRLPRAEEVRGARRSWHDARHLRCRAANTHFLSETGRVSRPMSGAVFAYSGDSHTLAELPHGRQEGRPVDQPGIAQVECRARSRRSGAAQRLLVGHRPDLTDLGEARGQTARVWRGLGSEGMVLQELPSRGLQCGWRAAVS
jgi:hypothetical protein